MDPGVYDIYSPVVPDVEWLRSHLEKSRQYLQSEPIWVNPDCGLKTRRWSEVLPAIRNMVEATVAVWSLQTPQPYRRGPSRQGAVAALVEQGRTQQQLAREWGVARATVKRWVQGERARGEAALAPRKQVRPPHPHWERASCPDQATDSRLPPTAAAACAVDPGSGR